MSLILGMVLNSLVFVGSWWIAGIGFGQSRGLPRGLATAVLGWTWITLGLQLLGPWGMIVPGPLLAWSTLLLAIGLVLRTARVSRAAVSIVIEHDAEPWRWETVVALAMLIWATSYVGMISLFLPVKVVSDGPIYHLYFAARWWKSGRLFLVPAPFGENAATYFPANGDLWFTWLMTGWGGDRLARIGQAPFLALAGASAYGLAQTLGGRRNGALIATACFLTSTPLLVFTFEGNVDTIFVAGYLTAAYFFMRFLIEEGGPPSLILGGLAAGQALGTKTIAIVFLPALMLLLVCGCWVRTRSPRIFLGALASISVSMLIPSGYWFARNAILTGNPLYPLHVTFLGRTLLNGCYSSAAMISSPYYLPISDWRSLADILLTVLDPRLSPFWLASLSGAWALGRGSRTTRNGWVWAISLLALANLCLYWIFIPYRTQQRFMLQALGLAVLPLSLMLDRFRWLGVTATILLAMHVLTPETWPFVLRERGSPPWDLSPVIPSDVASPVPFLTRIAKVLQPAESQSAPLLGLGLTLALGLASLVMSRSLLNNKKGPAQTRAWWGAAAMVPLILLLGSLETGATITEGRRLFFPPFVDFYLGWLNLDARSGPSGARVAYAGTNIPYYLFGSGLRNEVMYINVDSHRDWLLHDYHRDARQRGEATWPNARPGWDRIHPDFRAWIDNLKADRIQLLVVTMVNPEEGPHNVARQEGFPGGTYYHPIERIWADSHPEFFEPLYGVAEGDSRFRLYRFHPDGKRVPHSTRRP